MAGALFDISTFNVTLPTPRDLNCQVDMNGVRFYGGQQWKQNAGNYTFGADTPTYVLIGLVDPTFTPMLLAYGTVTLNNNNNGVDFYNYVSWTQGLYTVANQLQTSTESAQVFGGMAIQPMDGGFYTDSLINAGTDFTIKSFSNGTVTTNAPNSFTSGQKLQFANLTNPSGGVEDGSGCCVETVISLTEFTISALDGHDVTKAAANSGTVASIPSANDGENWGALVPNGQQMQLTSYAQRVANTFYAGFTPSRILFTRTKDAVPQPLLQFSGVQTVEYKRGNVTAGVGFHSANEAQYLEIDFRGYFQFVNANNDDNNEAVLTFALGATPGANLITTSGIAAGVLTITGQNPQAPLANGDWVHFISLNLPAPAALTVGTPYQVANVSGSTFQLIDPATNNPGFAGINASAATLIKETAIVQIDQQNVTVSGQTVNLTIVETSEPHGLVPGDAIVFKALNLQQGMIADPIYYVTNIFKDQTTKKITSFSFAEERGGVYNPITALPTSSGGGQVTLPLGQVGGLDVGGNATLTASFNGGFQSGDFVKPTDFTIGLSGSVSVSYSKELGTSLSGTFSLKGNSETSQGLVLVSENGNFNVAAAGFSISGSIVAFNSATNQPKCSIGLSGISGTMVRSENGTDTWSFNGSVSFDIPSKSWSGTANFGHGQVNGLTLTVCPNGDRFVQQLSASIVADFKPPNKQEGFTKNISIMSFNGNIDYNRDPNNKSDWTLYFGGAMTLAIGDSTPDANGNWKSTVDTLTLAVSPDAIELDGGGVKFLPGRYEIDINGPFKIAGKLNVVAQSLKLIYQSANPVTQTDEQILLSGGVVLPDLNNARIQFGNDGASGGLEIDVTDGSWKLNGFRIAVPKIGISALLQAQNLLIGFSRTIDSSGNTDYEIQAGVQIQILKGKTGGCNLGAHVTFDVDAGKLKIVDVGIAARNMNPGLPVLPIDGSLTDFAADVDGIPSSVSADLLFGAVFGSKVTVGAKEYSAVQAIVSGQYKYKDISVTGTVLFAGGTLGVVTGTFDANWGTGVYSLNIRGKMFYDVVEATAILYFSSTLDYGLFSARLQVPANIPLIGGMSVAEADAMYYVDHTSTGNNFLAAWFVFLGHWKYGVEIELVGNGQWKLIGTNTINGLEALIPSGVGAKANKYNLAYPPTAPTQETRQLRGLEDDQSSDSYGLINVVWSSPDGANDTIFIAAGSNNAVQVYGPGTTLDSSGWVDDPNGDVSYIVITDQSGPGNVLIHVAPTASFTALGASYDNPDLYVPLPSATLNVVLTSDNVQTGNTTANWTGSFAAAAPELQNLTVTQAQTVNALGDDVSDDSNPDPVTADNATISFQWRGLDPSTTNVSLYYDYNSSGFTGTWLTTVSGGDLTVSSPDGAGWYTVTVAWDIGALDPARPLYVYAAIKDAGHAAVTSDYAGQVQTVPAAQIQVSYTGGTQVTSAELEDITLMVAPVQAVSVTSISAGVVAVTASTNINVGDTFMFSGLTSPVGVQNTMPYYVVAVSSDSFTFSNVAAGAPLNEATAGQGTAYVDQDVPTVYGTNGSGLVWPQVAVNQANRFSMSPPRAVFAAAPASGQEVSNVGELIQYNTFVGNNQLLRMSFQFSVMAAIAGRVFNDFSDNGRLDSMDTGLAGATVFLDDNNNGVLDPGEDYVITGPDGNYLFVHQWADTDTPTTTYTTRVRVIPPAGWKVTSPSGAVSADITFTNNGNEQAALDYYNFMIASPVDLGGTVYDDANRDGVRDPGDKGLPGITVNVTPPSRAAIAAITDANGRWQATSYERGTYDISVQAPSGGTFTSATSVSFTLGAPTNLVLQGGAGGGVLYAQTCLASQWNPAVNGYSTWLAALTSGTSQSGLDFVNLSTNPTGNSTVVNSYVASIYSVHTVFRLDAFIGKWTAGGTPSLAVTYIFETNGGSFQTSLAVTPPSHETTTHYAAPGTVTPQLFALSWNPSQPDYSTVASIDMSGQVTAWTFNPARLSGSAFEGGFTAGSQTFKLIRGTPVKMVGFNKGGSDHFQSQDLAVAYSYPNGSLALAQWNHATAAISNYDIGGQVFVDMIAGDFDGNGHEDVAVLTADTNLQQYYLNVLLSQNDGSTELVPSVGSFLAATSGGTPGTNLASILVQGNQQALLWNTQSSDGSTKYISAALVNPGEIRISSGAATLSGRIAAIRPGNISTPATFAIYSMDLSSAHNIPAATGTVQVTANGQIAIDGGLTQYGGSFSGFDVGVTGVTPAASNVISGIVYNDANSNGIQDPGETGLPGITVRLIDPDNTVQTTTTSDGSDGQPAGSYSFDNVAANSYLQVLVPPGTWTAQNPPPGVSTNANGSDGIVVGVSFAGGQTVESIGFTDGIDNQYSVTMKSADLQGTGQQNLVIRASSALFVQRFQSDGTWVFDSYEVSSPAAYLRPQLYLADINGDGRIDIVTSGQSGIDVFLNIDLGVFRPFTGLLADMLTNSPNGSYGPGIGFTDDASSGVSSAKTYTHALNFGSTSNATVNGVTFNAAPSVGAAYVLEAADPRDGAAGRLTLFSDSAVLVTGNFATIAQTSYLSPASANGTEQLTVTALIPGVTYTTTFYTVGNNGAPQRVQTVVDSLGGSMTFDANGGQNLNGYMIKRAFTAISDSIVFTFFAQNPAFSLNLIALTNEVVTSGYSTTGYSTPVALAGDADSGIASGKYYTHALAFAAANPVTVNGVTFTPAAQTGADWALTAYNQNTGATPAMETLTGFNSSLTGNMQALVSSFFYTFSGQVQLILAGLTPGTTYTTTWYGSGYQAGVKRVASISDSLGGYAVIDENQFGAGNGIRFSRTFLATGNRIVYTFTAPDIGTEFQHYAVTNEIVPTGYTTPVAFTGDGDSGVSSKNNYTHALNFVASDPVAVNGVAFSPAGLTGSNWSLTASNPATEVTSPLEMLTGFNNSVTGNMNSLMSEFFWTYLGEQQLTLTGLAVGVMYTTTWYSVGYQPGVQRVTSISDSLGGFAVIDQNQFGSGNGILFSRTFTATSDSITFTFVAANAGYEFQQFAVTNQVVPTNHESPNICGTEVAVIPTTSSSPALIYAAQQNTQTVYELTWNTAIGTLASTGRFFPIDRLVTRMVAGSIVNEGEVDLVIFENSNALGDPVLPPGTPFSQKLWLYTPANLYATGTLISDFGTQKYNTQIDLLLAPLFSGVQTAVFMGTNPGGSGSTDVVTYRAGSGVNTTNLPGWMGIALNVGRFEPGSTTPDIVVAGFNSINVLTPGTDPSDPNNPTGPDPNVPLVVLGNNYTPYSWNAAAVGASATTNSDDLIAVRYDEAIGFSIVPFFNITGGYRIPANAGGGLYDFPLVVPGSNGGTISGNVFLDPNGSGQWAADDYGASDGITVYLDLNNNGVWDPNEPRAFPDSDGDYRFSQLPPGAYTVAIQAGTGYTLTTPVSADVTVPAVPGAQVNGVDFGVKTRNFGADFNNDHQPDLLLSDPTDQSVYVQLRNGQHRLGTYKVGTLPSSNWIVAGTHDVTGNGTADVLIHNVETGELRLWEFAPCHTTPTVARTIELNYVIPAGYTLLGVADLDANGQPELILGNKSNGDYRAVQLNGLDTSSGRTLEIPAGTSIVSAGDIDRDGNADLLLRDRKTDHLLIYLFGQGKPTKLIDVGKPNADWSVAGITGLLKGDQQEILFQEKSTGKAFAWTLDTNLRVASVLDLDIGTHNGLRVHLAEQ